MRYTDADILIQELIGNPLAFESCGKAEQLLNCYFRGHDIRTLVPLLSSDNTTILKMAIWIVSELGRSSALIVEYVEPLCRHDEKYVRYYALEIMATSAYGDVARLTCNLVDGLEDDEQVIRVRAMELLCGIDDDRWGMCLNYGNGKMKSGNHIVADQLKTGNELLINKVLANPDMLFRKLAIIEWRRSMNNWDDIQLQLKDCQDSDIAKFADRVM